MQSDFCAVGHDVYMLKKQSSTVFYRGGKSALRKKPRAGKPASMRRVAGPSAREQPRYRVGIWDIDVNAGFLFRVLDDLNDSQNLFRFNRVEATVPMGLTLAGERTRELVKSNGGDDSDPDIEKNVFAGDIIKVARPIMKSTKVTLLICVLAPMIMDRLTLAADGKDGIGWNYFSSSYNKIAVVSAYDLRRYATKANRPFEAALAAVVLGAVFASVFSKVEFHDATRGCVMDYCDRRDDIVNMLRKIDICDETWAQIPEKAHQSVRSMLDSIKEYKR
jgi:hypothetical protein